MHRRFMYRLVVLAVAVAVAAVAAAYWGTGAYGASPTTICLNGHTQQLPAQAAAVVLAHNPNAHAGACQPTGGGSGGGDTGGDGSGSGGDNSGSGGDNSGSGAGGSGSGGDNSGQSGDGSGQGSGSGTDTGSSGGTDSGGGGTVVGLAVAATSGSTNGVYRCNVWNGLYIVQSDKVAEDAAAGNRYANVILGKPYTGAPNTNPLQGSTVGHLACTSEGGTLIPGVVSDAKGYLYDPKLTGVGYGIGSPVYQG